ncbi:probable chitinase 10 [Rhagoletis pomonella]|uniref:probable chitinase 10 n=1 Tax=Rhagoletis pomonella TaxID=28610 RepID=UPI00178166AD|nr:probable chitinase 10 [Rhagoletis pomonella]
MGYKALLIIILISKLLSFHATFADTFEECDNAEEGTFVKSTQSCQTYIYCDGDNSYSGDCDEGQYFDGESCDDAENVYCALDVPEDPEQPAVSEDPDEPVPPATSTPKTTTTTRLPQATTIPTTTITTTTTTSSESINTLEPHAILPVVRDQCPASDDPEQLVLLTNAQSCTDYFLCYHGHPIEMRCTDNLHFNIYTAKCDFPENVQCMLDRPNANKCLPHVTDFFPHSQNCNYFYYCIRGFLTLQQCPFYYGWDIERRACVLIKQAKCFEGSKRTYINK